MTEDPVESELEAERRYWQTQLANLQMILCELLIKNERLRQERGPFPSLQSDQGAVLTNS